MMRSSRLLFTALFALVAPVESKAQTCLGLAPFSAGRIQIGATAESGNDTEAFGGSVAVGSPDGVFGGVSIGTVSYERFSENTTVVGASLGWQIPMGSGNRAQLCPGGGIVFGLGPGNISGSPVNMSSHTAFFGLQLGISAGDGLRMVPTAGAALVYSKLDWEGGYFGGEDRTDLHGLLSLGVGLVVSPVSIRPGIDIPIGLQNADPSLGITLTLNFARPRHSP